MVIKFGVDSSFLSALESYYIISFGFSQFLLKYLLLFELFFVGEISFFSGFFEDFFFTVFSFQEFNYDVCVSIDFFQFILLRVDSTS